MPTKILGLHHVLGATALRIGPQVEYRVSPARLGAVLDEHQGWRFVDRRGALDSPPRRERRLLVTIDDGYVDALTEALPVLEACNAPCLLFVVTGWTEGTVRPMEADLAWLASQLPAERGAQVYRRQRRRLSRWSPQRQRAALERLAVEHGLADPSAGPRPTLDWEQLARLAGHPLIEIGSHTESHPRFGPFDAGLARREAARSRQRLEEVLGRPVECFAYPYGRNSLLIRRAVSQCGYRYAFTTRPRLISDADRIDPMAVPRFMIDGPQAAERAAA